MTTTSMYQDEQNVANFLRCHDIRTPLHAMQSGFELLGSGAAGNLSATAKDLLGQMAQSCQTLETMLGRLIAASSGDGHANAVQIDDLPIATLIMNLPVEHVNGGGRTNVQVERQLFSSALELIVYELLEAESANPALSALDDERQWTLSTDRGAEPASGNHQITAFLVRRQLTRCNWRFLWPERGTVILTPNS